MYWWSILDCVSHRRYDTHHESLNEETRVIVCKLLWILCLSLTASTAELNLTAFHWTFTMPSLLYVDINYHFSKYSMVLHSICLRVCLYWICRLQKTAFSSDRSRRLARSRKIIVERRKFSAQMIAWLCDKILWFSINELISTRNMLMHVRLHHVAS